MKSLYVLGILVYIIPEIHLQKKKTVCVHTYVTIGDYVVHYEENDISANGVCPLFSARAAGVVQMNVRDFT